MLQLFIKHIDRLLRERKIQAYPWLVDFHDESIFECPADQADAMAQVMVDALAATNEELGMEIAIKGTPMIVDNLAEIKDPAGYKEMMEAAHVATGNI